MNRVHKVLEANPRGAPCSQCVHYFITFDVRFPYGCRAMGFKSRQQPKNEILAATGEACVTFTPKVPLRR